VRRRLFSIAKTPAAASTRPLLLWSSAEVTFDMQTISKAHVERAVEVLDELFPLMEVPAR
jgi:hypothetical protein